MITEYPYSWLVSTLNSKLIITEYTYSWLVSTIVIPDWFRQLLNSKSIVDFHVIDKSIFMWLIWLDSEILVLIRLDSDIRVLSGHDWVSIFTWFDLTGLRSVFFDDTHSVISLDRKVLILSHKWVPPHSWNIFWYHGCAAVFQQVFWRDFKKRKNSDNCYGVTKIKNYFFFFFHNYYHCNML